MDSYLSLDHILNTPTYISNSQNVLTPDQLSNFTVVNPLTSELVVPSVAGILLVTNMLSGQAIRVCGSSNTSPGSLTGGTLGTTSKQIQFYNDGNLTAVMDVSGCYVNGILNASNFNTSDTNIAIGKAFNAISTGTGNIAVGFQALLKNSNGYANISIGYQSLPLNTSGFTNIAIGYQSLAANTLGYENVAVGHQTLLKNIDGYANVAVGYQTLAANTTGYANVSVGYQSLAANTLGNKNASTGHQTLLANTTGYHNVAVGYQSLVANTTGYNNISVGANTATGITTGYNNIYIGANTNSSSPSVQNEIVIGNGTTGNGINTCTIKADKGLICSGLFSSMKFALNLNRGLGSETTRIPIPRNSSWILTVNGTTTMYPGTYTYASIYMCSIDNNGNLGATATTNVAGGITVNYDKTNNQLLVTYNALYDNGGDLNGSLLRLL